MKLFTDTLSEKVLEKKSTLFLSLDPNVDLLPEEIEKSPAGILEFGTKMIEALKGMVVGVKFQLAYYEIWGAEGFAVLEKLKNKAKKEGLITMMDGKRNDIGQTAQAYAQAYLKTGPLSADSLTITPFLGSDGVLPFVQPCKESGKGIFVLVRTSNPSAAEVQGVGDLSVRICELINDWNLTTQSEKNDFTSIGAVIGATIDVKLMEFFRQELPHSWLLMPGVGPQGGSMKHCLGLTDKDGLGVILPIGRAILYASSGPNWLEASHKAAQEYFEKQREILWG